MQSQAAPATLLRTRAPFEPLVRRFGPPAVMASAIVILPAWIALIGYGLVSLIALAF